MDKWARIFNVCGRQVMVYKNNDPDGDPCITFRFPSNSRKAFVSLDYGYNDWRTRDELFQQVTAKLVREVVETAKGVNL